MTNYLGDDFLTEEQRKMAQHRSTFPTDFEEKTGVGSFQATLITNNSLAGGWDRYQYNKNWTPSEPTPSPEVKIQEKEFFDAIGNYPDNVAEHLTGHYFAGGIKTRQDLQREVEYVNRHNLMSAQSVDAYGTVGSVVLGVGTGLVDWDILLGGVFTKSFTATAKIATGLYKGLKVPTNVANVLGRGTAGVVTGGAFGAVSQSVYNTAVDTYDEDSVVNASLFGMVLGGGIGAFTARANQVQQNKIAQTQSAIADRQENLKSMLDNIQEGEYNLKLKEEEALRHTEKYKKTKEFVGEARVDVKRTETLKKQTDKHNEVIKNTEELIKQADSKYTELKNKPNLFKELTENELKRIEKNKEKIQALNETESKRIKQSEKAKTKKGLSKTQLKARATATEQNIKLNLKANTKQTYTKKEEKILANHEKYVKSLHDRVAENRAKLEGIDTEMKDIEARAVAREESAKAYGLDKSDINKTKEDLDTMKQSQQTLDDEVKQLKKQQVTWVRKYSDELESIERVFDGETFDLDSINRYNAKFPITKSWLHNMAISPIAKLYGSDNAYVKAVASLLHENTFNTGGKQNIHNAMTITRKYAIYLQQVHQQVAENFNKAKAEGYTGTKEEFSASVKMEQASIIANRERDIIESMPLSDLDEYIKALYERDVPIRHSNNNPHIQKSALAFLDYYKMIGEKGKMLEIEGLVNTTVAKGYYSPRLGDRDRILQLDPDEAVAKQKAIDLLYNAQKRKAMAINRAITPELDLSFKGRAEKFVESSLDRNQIVNELTRRFSQRPPASTSNLKMRSIDVFEDDIASIVRMDAVTESLVYGRGIHGKLALKSKLGVENNVQMDNLLRELEKNGATHAETKRVKAVIETVLGTREITKNPLEPTQVGIKLASSLTSLSFIGGFGVTTLLETAFVGKDVGYGRILKHLIPSMKQTKDLYLNGTVSDKNTIGLQNAFGNTFLQRTASRYDTGDNIFEAGTQMQHWVDGANHQLAKWGGLLPITDVLRQTVSSAAIDWLARLSVKQGKISKADVKRLNDIGFGIEDLPQIKKALKVDETGAIGEFDITKWGDMEDILTNATLNLVNRTILHPSGATLPMFMTNVDGGAFISKIVMKFMRFPVEAYERFLLRGMQEMDARQAVAIMTSFAGATLMLQLKDLFRSKERYTDDEQGQMQLLIDALGYTPVLSFPFAIADKVGSLFSDYSPISPVNSVMQDFLYNQEVGMSFGLFRAKMDLGGATAYIANTLATYTNIASLLPDTWEETLDKKSRKFVDSFNGGDLFEPSVKIPNSNVDINSLILDKRFEGIRSYKDVMNFGTLGGFNMNSSLENYEEIDIINDLYDGFVQSEGWFGDFTGAALTGARGLTTKLYKEMRDKYGQNISEETASKLYLKEANEHFKKVWGDSYRDESNMLKKALLDTAYNMGYRALTNFKGLSSSIMNDEAPTSVMLNLLDTANLTTADGKGSSRGIAKRRAEAYNMVATPETRITTIEQFEDGTIAYYSYDTLVFSFSNRNGRHPTSDVGRLEV